MWKLTIKQTTKKKYNDTEFDTEEEVAFKSERIEGLAAIVTELSELEESGVTEYKIEREVEKNESV